jgi:hypothetical protein
MRKGKGEEVREAQEGSTQRLSAFFRPSGCKTAHQPRIVGSARFFFFFFFSILFLICVIL